MDLGKISDFGGRTWKLRKHVEKMTFYNATTGFTIVNVVLKYLNDMKILSKLDHFKTVRELPRRFKTSLAKLSILNNVLKIF